MKKMLCFVLVSLLLVVFPVYVLAMEPLRMEPDFMGFPWGTTMHELLIAKNTTGYVDALDNGYIRVSFDSDIGQITFGFLSGSLEYGIIWLDESQNVKTPEDAIGYLSEYGKYIGITENYYYWNLENLHIEVGTNDNDVLYILFERPGLDESEDDMPKGAIEITSIDLLAAYEENAVGADMKYLNKLLAVTGEIGSIDTDFLGDPYVTLTDGERFSLSSVQCYFNDAYITDIGSLKKGENITIIGYCDGKSLNVQMKECYLAD